MPGGGDIGGRASAWCDFWNNNGDESYFSDKKANKFMIVTVSRKGKEIGPRKYRFKIQQGEKFTAVKVRWR